MALWMVCINSDSPDISDECLDEEMSLKLARVIYSTESLHMSAFI